MSKDEAGLMESGIPNTSTQNLVRRDHEGLRHRQRIGEARREAVHEGIAGEDQQDEPG